MSHPADVLRKAFSFPSNEELADQDECVVTCRECGAEWEVVMLNHAFTRGTVNSLLAHGQSHQPGRPGMRRLS